MRTLILIATAALLLPTLASADGMEPAWFWRATCGEKALLVQVQLDSQILNREVVPICRRARERAVRTPTEQTMLSFDFEPRRRIEWSGYRPGKEWSPASEKLKLDIWEAAPGSDAIALGVSVLGPSMIWMHTIIFAYPDKPSHVTLAPGLQLKIDPARK